MIKIIGGTFEGSCGGKPSGVVDKLGKALNGHHGGGRVNGGNLAELKKRSELLRETTIWMPNVSNSVDKIYPKKQTGCVLICSKVLRENRTLADAVARIFTMRANAVIAINTDSKPYKFTLVDALGNTWADTRYIGVLASAIKSFSAWSYASIRRRSTCFNKGALILPSNDWLTLKDLCKINKKLADVVQNKSGSRYFGNLSTRCMGMFPSCRSDVNGGVLVSKRNINKERVAGEDFVLAWSDGCDVHYIGEGKPSVDTPIQLTIYNRMPFINYMIHGHAYIKDAPFTDNYHACGDIREAREIRNTLAPKTLDEILTTSEHKFAINLRNHGFLIGARYISDMDHMVENFAFKPKPIGESLGV